MDTTRRPTPADLLAAYRAARERRQDYTDRLDSSGKELTKSDPLSGAVAGKTGLDPNLTALGVTAAALRLAAVPARYGTRKAMRKEASFLSALKGLGRGARYVAKRPIRFALPLVPAGYVYGKWRGGMKNRAAREELAADDQEPLLDIDPSNVQITRDQSGAVEYTPMPDLLALAGGTAGGLGGILGGKGLVDRLIYGILGTGAGVGAGLLTDYLLKQYAERPSVSHTAWLTDVPAGRGQQEQAAGVVERAANKAQEDYNKEQSAARKQKFNAIKERVRTAAAAVAGGTEQKETGDDK